MHNIQFNFMRNSFDIFFTFFECKVGFLLRQKVFFPRFFSSSILFSTQFYCLVRLKFTSQSNVSCCLRFGGSGKKSLKNKCKSTINENQLSRNFPSHLLICITTKIAIFSFYLYFSSTNFNSLRINVIHCAILFSLRTDLLLSITCH